VVKVDDTVSGIGEALEGGCWGVGVTRYSNYMDVNSLEEGEALTEDEIKRRMLITEGLLRKAGAHYVIDSIAGSDCAYIINSGSVGVYREDSLGKRSLVQELGAHAMFGEMGLIDKYPRSATVVALENTKCMVIERPRFDYLKKFNSHFMIKLIKSFTERLRATIAKLNQRDPSSKNSPANKMVAINNFH
jgi:CRP-like cAMP-binding protein